MNNLKRISEEIARLRFGSKQNRDDIVLSSEQEISKIMENSPSGSGFDNGTVIDLLKSTETKIVFVTSYHHMNDVGHYIFWTHHTITVTPLFYDFSLVVSGQNVGDIKDYIADCFSYWLSQE